MKGILFIISITFFVNAKILEVSSQKLSFKLDLSDEKINLESIQSTVEVNKVRCNQEAFEIFHTKFNQNFKKKVLSANSDKAINVTLDKKSYAINPNSSLAHFLSKVHESVFALKILEGKVCE